MWDVGLGWLCVCACCVCFLCVFFVFLSFADNGCAFLLCVFSLFRVSFHDFGIFSLGIRRFGHPHRRQLQLFAAMFCAFSHILRGYSLRVFSQGLSRFGLAAGEVRQPTLWDVRLGWRCVCACCARFLHGFRRFRTLCVHLSRVSWDSGGDVGLCSWVFVVFVHPHRGQRWL